MKVRSVKKLLIENNVLINSSFSIKGIYGHQKIIKPKEMQNRSVSIRSMKSKQGTQNWVVKIPSQQNLDCETVYFNSKDTGVKGEFVTSVYSLKCDHTVY